MVTDLAEEDLEKIGDYIFYNLNAPKAAFDTINGIRWSLDKLKVYPKRHELDEDIFLAELGIRKQYYKNFKSYYIVDDINRKVIILRIFHMHVDSKAYLYQQFRL